MAETMIALIDHMRTTRAATGLSPSAALNLAFRRTLAGGQVMVSSGVADLPPRDRLAVLDAVRAFDAFHAGADPYGPQDFGAVEHDGVRYFWKIEAYDRSYALPSPDPANPAMTARVLMIMRDDEY
ncbi:DUF3768 domain-containing protein [Aureimonas frigidaquae]|uniref:DUF3768 domain-containing protein n=1 Tax=Aureimonas frigidaquae TaxID=424757 RepID=A0A0P0Z0I9_9HYPH|nr:DUF3768 domain-containing protein [Aureimonas frigidaquae]BAT27371.1 hypothetical protein [Aureimonas frigidaquae]